MSYCSYVLNGLPDLLVQNEGTILLVTPLTPRAESWIADNVQPDAQWFGDALVVECRFARDLAQGMKRTGLRVEFEN